MAAPFLQDHAMSNLQNAARMGPAQNVTSVSGTSTSSTAFGTQTRYIRVQATTTTVNFRVGPGTLTAVTTDTLLNSTYPEYFLVNPGETIACIGAGTVNVTECLT
jgi:hypothetical protein